MEEVEDADPLLRSAVVDDDGVSKGKEAARNANAMAFYR